MKRQRNKEITIGHINCGQLEDEDVILKMKWLTKVTEEPELEKQTQNFFSLFPTERNSC